MQNAVRLTRSAALDSTSTYGNSNLLIDCEPFVPSIKIKEDGALLFKGSPDLKPWERIVDDVDSVTIDLMRRHRWKLNPRGIAVNNRMVGNYRLTLSGCKNVITFYNYRTITIVRI